MTGPLPGPRAASGGHDHRSYGSLLCGPPDGQHGSEKAFVDRL